VREVSKEDRKGLRARLVATSGHRVAAYRRDVGGILGDEPACGVSAAPNAGMWVVPNEQVVTFAHDRRIDVDELLHRPVGSVRGIGTHS
jgi:hypothetical protein